VSDLHARFTDVWGIVSSGPAGIILEAPRDAADGIGSALAVSDADLLAKGPVRVSWEVQERWGGEEDWRGFWLMFAPPKDSALCFSQERAEELLRKCLGTTGPNSDILWQRHAQETRKPRWPHPMHYYRPTSRGFEIGEVTGGRPEDQKIRETWTGADEDEPHMPAHVGFADGAIHITSMLRGTVSLPIGPRLLGLYVEGSRVAVRVERG